jgi:hypothetical protein
MADEKFDLFDEQVNKILNYYKSLNQNMNDELKIEINNSYKHDEVEIQKNETTNLSKFNQSELKKVNKTSTNKSIE